jgi:hypothetical protein
MNSDVDALRELNRDKALRTLDHVAASLSEYQTFDPAINYTPKSLEPYDALADRFVRAIECCLRHFRSQELREFGEQSETTRNLLNRMEKLGWVSDASLWLTMRNIRNRIVHDYLPEQTAQMYAEISGPYGTELARLRTMIAEVSDMP